MAVRTGGLHEALRAAGVAFRDSGDLQMAHAECAKPGIKNFAPTLQAIGAVQSVTSGSLRHNHIPLVLGGDHSLAMGTVAAAFERFGKDLAVLWLDAHADLNTPDTSPSGNMHGMPLAALLGFDSASGGSMDTQWRKLQKCLIPKGPMEGERIAWIGLRDVDAGEATRLHGLSGEYVATMHDVDRHGLVECLMRFDRWMRDSGATKLWISFDVDALDPILAPGTGTAVRGGLTYREMHLAGELLHELLSAPKCPYALAGMDLVEINPIHDRHNETACTAAEFIGSVFGKTILGKP